MYKHITRKRKLQESTIDPDDTKKQSGKKLHTTKPESSASQSNVCIDHYRPINDYSDLYIS